MKLPPVLFEESCVFIIFNYSRFLLTADAHTSTSLHEASRETREQRSNLGLDTAEHRLHCYIDHNSGGCCSGYEPARGEVPKHYNYFPNLCAIVGFREML